jgi:hypothetical protein
LGDEVRDGIVETPAFFSNPKISLDELRHFLLQSGGKLHSIDALTQKDDPTRGDRWAKLERLAPSLLCGFE